MQTELVIVGLMLSGSVVWLVVEVSLTMTGIRVSRRRRAAIAVARADEQGFIDAMVEAESRDLDHLEAQVAEWA